jgi:hypothetical protein
MSGTMSPNGTIALQGGGPFDANDDLDRRLLAAAGAQQVLVLPTADAFERPERLVAAAMNWGERLGVEVEALDGDAPWRGDGAERRQRGAPGEGCLLRG